MSSSATSVQVQMPQMGISVSEGTILEWRKAVGDTVAADEPICDVTTDKVDVEIPCPASGVLAKIVAEPGDTVPVGEVDRRDRVRGGGLADGSAARPRSTRRSLHRPERSDGARSTRLPRTWRVRRETDRSRFVSPVVRRMAEEHGIDLSQVEGHGVGGRIRKKDLMAHIEAASAPGEAVAAACTSSRRTCPSPRRRTAPGTAMLPSRRARGPARGDDADAQGDRRAHGPQPADGGACTTIVEVDFSAVAARRAELKETLRRPRRAAHVPRVRRPGGGRGAGGVPDPERLGRGRGDRLPRRRQPRHRRRARRRPDRAGDPARAAALARGHGGRDRRRRRSGRATRKLEPGRGPGRHVHDHQPRPVRRGAGDADHQPAAGRRSSISRRSSSARWWCESDGQDAIAIRPMAYLPLSWDHRALDGADAARFLGGVKERLEGGDVR